MLVIGGGTITRDPHHGDNAEEEFHPWRSNNGWFLLGLLWPKRLKYGDAEGECCEDVDEADIKNCIVAFVADFVAKNTSWRYPLPPNCHSFQNDMMKACCMTKTKDD